MGGPRPSIAPSLSLTNLIFRLGEVFGPYVAKWRSLIIKLEPNERYYIYYFLEYYNYYLIFDRCASGNKMSSSMEFKKKKKKKSSSVLFHFVLNPHAIYINY